MPPDAMEPLQFLIVRFIWRDSQQFSESSPRSFRVELGVVGPAVGRIAEWAKQVIKVGPAAYGSGSTF